MSPRNDDHEFRASEPIAAPDRTAADAPPCTPAWREARYLDAVLDSMAEVVVVADANGVIARLNRAARIERPWIHVGMTLEELAAVTPLFEADGRTPVPPRGIPIGRALRGETLASRRYVVVPPGRPPLVLDISAAPLYDGGELFGAVVVSHDVTARHQAQARLAAHVELLDEAERAAAIGCWRLDVPTGRVTWSDGMFRLLGYEPDAITPSIEAYQARLHPEDHPPGGLDRAMSLIFEDTPIKDHRIVRPDGRVAWLRHTGRIERDASGRPLRAIGVAQDVTEKIEAERAKADFLAVVSHELRTPLTMVRAPLQMLARGLLDPTDPRARELLDLAAQAAERMTRLVGDIHDMERLTSGRVAIRLAPTPARTLVADAVGALRARAEEGQVRLEVDAADLTVRADRDRAGQVLTNLVENAVKYSPPGGTVRVALSAHDGMACFQVEDEGPGIPVDQREAIFERFVQLGEKSTRPTSGLGLGLAIAREIVAAHGGRIWVEPREGGGSRFGFTLPLADPGPAGSDAGPAA